MGAPNRLASHPISELVANGGEEEAIPGDIEDEFEGTLRAVALTGPGHHLGSLSCPDGHCTPASNAAFASPACVLVHPFAGVCAANASSDDFSDVGDDTGPADTEVVFVKVGGGASRAPAKKWGGAGKRDCCIQEIYTCGLQ